MRNVGKSDTVQAKAWTGRISDGRTMVQTDDEITRDNAPLSAEQIIDIVGPLADDRIMAIVATGATVEEVEEAAAWADGENDVMADLKVRATAPIAAVYDILRAEAKYAEDRD